MANPHRFYIPSLLAPGSTETLTGQTAHHIRKVLRLRDGDAVWVWNGDGQFREGSLHMSAEHLQIRVGQRLPAAPQSPLQITLLQGLPEGDKMDWIIEKACEAGVDRIIPVQARRSVVRLSGDRAAKRFDHWQRVAIAACSQCGRARLPELLPVCTPQQGFEQAAKPVDTFAQQNPSHLALHALLDPASTQSAVACILPFLSDAIARSAHASEHTDSTGAVMASITLAIGPEGGWDALEVREATENCFTPVSLGGHTLRTETAGLVAIAQVQAWLQALAIQGVPGPNSV